MTASEINYQGALNFVAGFWRETIEVLSYEGQMPVKSRRKAETLAWLGGKDFRDMCRFGGVDFDPDWLCDVLLSGEVPESLRFEDY